MQRPVAGAKGSVRVIEAGTFSAFNSAAADWLCDRLRADPQAVLALPTGNTPLGLYAELATRHRAGEVRFDRARVFNLDEYCGLGVGDSQSFASYMQRHVVAPLALRADQVRLLEGDAEEIALECRAYDEALATCGGIDLCVLGLGANGHIAFNEPGTPWNLRTHVVDLSEATRAAQRRPAQDGWAVPRRGVTLGIATLVEAREVLLLIAGAGKARAADALYRGVPTLDWPVSCLGTHPNLTVVHLADPRP